MPRWPAPSLALIVVAVTGLVSAPQAQGRRPATRAPQLRAQAQPAPREGSVRPGDLAPDFSLEPRGGGAPIILSAFRGLRPVALVFGSYT
jgi:hypothetical protein